MRITKGLAVAVCALLLAACGASSPRARAAVPERLATRNASGEEQGLLSMAFAPDYAQSGRFYVDYTGANGNLHIVQCRHAGNSNVAGGRAPVPR